MKRTAAKGRHKVLASLWPGRPIWTLHLLMAVNLPKRGSKASKKAVCFSDRKGRCLLEIKNSQCRAQIRDPDIIRVEDAASSATDTFLPHSGTRAASGRLMFKLDKKPVRPDGRYREEG